MFDVSYIEEILRKLLSRDESAFNYALHLSNLQKHYHWLIDPKIALMLINKGDEYVTKYVAEELSYEVEKGNSILNEKEKLKLL